MTPAARKRPEAPWPVLLVGCLVLGAMAIHALRVHLAGFTSRGPHLFASANVPWSAQRRDVGEDVPTSRFSIQGIEIDGNYVDDEGPGEDWYWGFPPFRYPGRQDDCGRIPPAREDFPGVYEGQELSNAYVANNVDFLFVGMERYVMDATTDTKSFAFSFDVTRDGPSFGDFVFMFCFGRGVAVADAYVLEYDVASGEFVRDATPPTVTLAVNDEPTLAPFGALDRFGKLHTTIGVGYFGEARVPLAEIEGLDARAVDELTPSIRPRKSPGSQSPSSR